MRDTIARRSDVDKDSLKYDLEPGNQKYRNATISFAAKKGQSFDPKGLQANLSATRLAKGTRSGVNYLEITALGEVIIGAKETVLKVNGTAQPFVLGDDPKAKPPQAGKKTAHERLLEAVKNGAKIVSVTGRIRGWSGVWPTVLRDLKEPAQGEKRPVLIVTDFELAKL